MQRHRVGTLGVYSPGARLPACDRPASLDARAAMLPPRHRLRSSADFTAVMRAGQRAARNTVVVHALSRPATEPRFGLVVGRTVGNSVVRHEVSRRLRGLLAARLDHVPAGTDVVVRARPEAAGADSRRLGADLDGALETVSRRLARSGACS